MSLELGARLVLQYHRDDHDHHYTQDTARLSGQNRCQRVLRAIQPFETSGISVMILNIIRLFIFKFSLSS